jgi:CBS-domain-containing membrane protein
VKDAMRTDIVPVTTEDKAERVERRLLSDHIKSLPVQDSRTGDLAGIVSLEDLLRVPARNGTKIGDFMSTDVVTTSTEDRLDRVMELLSHHDISSIPVLERSASGSKLVGMISRREVAPVYSQAIQYLLNKDRVE